MIQILFQTASHFSLHICPRLYYSFSWERDKREERWKELAMRRGKVDGEREGELKGEMRRES